MRFHAGAGSQYKIQYSFWSYLYPVKTKENLIDRS